MQPYAFYGTADNVTIQYVTVEKYATPAQRGAVGGDASGAFNLIGTNWTVDTVEARWNHGGGIVVNSGSRILSSFIHHNGQIGVNIHGAGPKLTNSEISWNNYAGFTTDWEAGGSKSAETDGLAVSGNYCHDNNGDGFWSDTDNISTVYENNTIVNNTRQGIHYEVSYNAVISNNVIKGNGSAPTTSSLWDAQIALQESSHVEVYGNTIEVPAGYGNGIGIMSEYRGMGAYGPFAAAHNSIHDNTITYRASNGYSGLVDDGTATALAVGNLFDKNHYILKGANGSYWTWFKADTWAQFQAAGQETHGTCCGQ
jgi:parallel beta-helix repeat protein